MDVWRISWLPLLILLALMHGRGVGATPEDERVKCRHAVTIEEDCTGGRFRRKFLSRAAITVPFMTGFGEYPGILLPYSELKDLELTKGVVGFNSSHAMLLLGMAAFFGVSSSASLSLSLFRPATEKPLIFIRLTSKRDLKAGDLLTVQGEKEASHAPTVPKQEEICVEEEEQDVTWESALFGCDDHEHISVDPDGFIMAVQGFDEGERVESSHATLIDDAYFHESDIDDYLWQILGCCKLLSTGLVMSLAEVSDDVDVVNTRYIWTWQDEDKRQGIVTVTSTKAIKPGEKLVLPSLAVDGRKHLVPEMTKGFKEKPTFADSSCDFVMHKATYGEEEGLRVISARPYPSGRLIERVPAAAVEIKAVEYSVVNDYVFGFNSTHAIITFGIAMILGHAEHKNSRTAFTHPPFFFGRLGVSDIELISGERIGQDREIYNKYGTETWFQERGVQYVPQDATTGHVPNVQTSPDRFQGCSDPKHLLVKGGTLRSSFLIDEGTVIETSRMLFTQRRDIQTQQARELFWNLEPNVVGVFIGLSMTFARMSSVAGEANIKYVWHTIEKDKSMGIVVVVATKSIPPFNEIVVPCERGSENDLFRTPMAQFTHDFEQGYGDAKYK